MLAGLVPPGDYEKVLYSRFCSFTCRGLCPVSLHAALSLSACLCPDFPSDKDTSPAGLGSHPSAAWPHLILTNHCNDLPPNKVTFWGSQDFNIRIMRACNLTYNPYFILVPADWARIAIYSWSNLSRMLLIWKFHSWVFGLWDNLSRDNQAVCRKSWT